MSATTMTVLAVLFAVAMVVLSALIAPKSKAGRPTATFGPLTKREQPMYFRLREAFPEHVVLAQVAFSALLTSRKRATRNTFDKKVADFVVCSTGFKVLAVVELDDLSHKDRTTQDAARDSLLTGAGYTVLRYKHVPDASTLRAALQQPAAAANAATTCSPNPP